MNDHAGAGAHRRSVSPPAARTAAAIVAAAGVALLGAACGGSTGSHVVALGSTAATESSGNRPAASAHQGGALELSRCMRSHGAVNFPDPASGGVIPKVALEHLGVSGSRFASAQRACQHLLPNGGNGPNQAQLQRIRSQGLRFSQCMRSHGVASFPDPDSSGRIPDPASLRPPIDQGAPRFQTANRACGTSRPPYFPSNAAYNAFARANG